MTCDTVYYMFTCLSDIFNKHRQKNGIPIHQSFLKDLHIVKLIIN